MRKPKPMTFEVDGKPSNLKAQPRPALARLTSFLDKREDGKLLTSKGLSDLLGVSFDSVVKMGNAAPGYRVKNGMGHSYWGNPATVKQAREVLGV